MDKVLIRQHLNTLHLVMNHLQKEIDELEARVPKEQDRDPSFNHYIYVLKEHVCDLDTIRQEYQKELDKWANVVETVNT